MYEYPGVCTRFLRDDERFILSDEKEMPLVIEAQSIKSAVFLHQFLAANANQLVTDIAKYGAVLFRGFDINSEQQFEKAMMSIPDFHGISEAFMSENGRTHVGELKYVLHTNSVYKTGGTLYLGGFHTENYYSADVPSYIGFFCMEPSALGGETGIINTEKIYRQLSDELKNKLEDHAYFVSKWLVSEVAERYHITTDKVEEICAYFELPVVGEGEERFVLMYKPSVFEHPLTKEKAMQINLFELPTLNDELRKCFMSDYQGKAWLWHRFFWKLPRPVFNAIESVAMGAIALAKSPRNSYQIVKNKAVEFMAKRKTNLPPFDEIKVGSCFNTQEVKELAESMRTNYSSCLWNKGDIMLIDNRKVMHAGMPGVGPRVIRAIIGNPVDMHYTVKEPGCIHSSERRTATIGSCMASGRIHSAFNLKSQSPVHRELEAR
ncbi:TauD/TfdA family dioxygenase [Legionella rowbothamii]|uniref:TauD/TfdA family dioxygenase n=1 Tax=Legionella rowbothamii TaxID=96229 RepID=UPI001056377E|nr:TauD/TfdA family dioxygenase [Legionella rowbothamii]